MASTKSKGESGSPCHRPLQCLIGAFGIPLSRTRDEEVESKAAIQSRHLEGKPSFYMKLSRYSQRTESKAFVMSNFLKKGWSVVSMETPCCITDDHEVVMDASSLSEGTLVRRDQLVHMWCKSRR